MVVWKQKGDLREGGGGCCCMGKRCEMCGWFGIMRPLLGVGFLEQVGVMGPYGRWAVNGGSVGRGRGSLSGRLEWQVGWEIGRLNSRIMNMALRF